MLKSDKSLKKSGGPLVQPGDCKASHTACLLGASGARSRLRANCEKLGNSRCNRRRKLGKRRASGRSTRGSRILLGRNIPTVYPRRSCSTSLKSELILIFACYGQGPLLFFAPRGSACHRKCNLGGLGYSNYGRVLSCIDADSASRPNTTTSIVHVQFFFAFFT